MHKFLFYFGIAWLAITVFISLGFLSFGMVFRAVPGDAIPNGFRFAFIFPMVIIFLFFFALGIAFTVIGYKKIKKDKETDRRGIVTYGRILDILGTNCYVNGRQELKAQIATYIPVENVVEVMEEILGTEPIHYSTGMYLQLKLYNGDINIISVIEDSSVPINIREMIETKFTSSNANNNTVYIDGVKYVRSDSSNEYHNPQSGW